MTTAQMTRLSEDHPDLYRDINAGKSLLLNQCYNNRNGEETSASSRIVGGKPSPPGTNNTFNG